MRSGSRRGSSSAPRGGRCASILRAATCIRPKRTSSPARRRSRRQAGVYHYAPDRHALERRCAFDAAAWDAAVADGESWLIALTSIHWREAWKYGERAFRYCQHDMGHAIAAVRIAAALAGLARDAPARLAARATSRRSPASIATRTTSRRNGKSRVPASSRSRVVDGGRVVARVARRCSTQPARQVDGAGESAERGPHDVVVHRRDRRGDAEIPAAQSVKPIHPANLPTHPIPARSDPASRA